MSSVAQTLRGMLERSFTALPILLFGWSMFVGSTTGNIGLLVLALGHATVVPLTTWILHTLASFTGEWGRPYVTVAASSTCNIIPGSSTDPGELAYAVPSYWVAQISYFFGFLLTNARGVYSMPTSESADKEKVERRKSQAQMVQILGWIFFILFLGVRVFVMKCETVLGMLLGPLGFWWLGYGWYQLARECSARDSDILGIVQGVLPPSAYDPPPMTCVYTGK